MLSLAWTILALTAPAAMAAAEPEADWAHAAAARLALLQQQLLSEPSATLVLARWCETFRLAPAPRIVAHRVTGADAPVPADVRANLKLGSGEPIGYRRVQLSCGGHVLSDAENWYVPDRLTPAMNASLDRTDTPFGLAVRSLHFTRKTISSDRLWREGAALPAHVLRNVGLLTVPKGLPIAQVVESYTAAVLGPGDR